MNTMSTTKDTGNDNKKGTTVNKFHDDQWSPGESNKGSRTQIDIDHKFNPTLFFLSKKITH